MMEKKWKNNLFAKKAPNRPDPRNRKVYSEGTNRVFFHYQKRDDSGVRVDLMDNEIEAHSM